MKNKHTAILTAIVMTVLLVIPLNAKITGWTEAEMTLLFDALDSNQEGVFSDDSWYTGKVTVGGDAGTPSAIVLTNGTGLPAASVNNLPIVFCIACSDETTALAAGTGVLTFRMPQAMTLTEVRGSVGTAPTGTSIIVDINEGGSTIMNTNKIEIEVSETTSEDATTAPALTDTALADDAEIKIDIDQIGSGTEGTGLKVCFIGTAP